MKNPAFLLNLSSGSVRTVEDEQRREKTRARVAIFRAKHQQKPACNAPVTLANAGNAMQKQMQKQMQKEKEKQETLVGIDAALVGALPATQAPRAAVVAPTSADAEWLAGLKSDPAYAGIDVDREHAKMLRWCQVNRKQPTRRRFVNWLNRVDTPIAASTNRPPPDSTF